MEGFPQRYRIRWEVSLFLRLALAVATGSGSLAAQELPPAIQADRLLLRAEREIQTGREQEGPAGRRVYYYDAFLTLTEVLELQAEHDLDIPAVFFKYAQMALEVGECGWHGGPESAVPTRAKTARASVLRYLELTGRGGEHYRAALELLDEAERRVDGARYAMARAERRAAEAEERTAELLETGEVFRDCAVCPVMVEVPAGSFMMGSRRPPHSVTIGAAFAVGVYEVTFEEWDACVRAGGCGGHEPDDIGWGRGRRPVMNVSWEDARGYVEWLSAQTGERYRLLSDAEWEYVARAGTETMWYWGGRANRNRADT